MKEQRPKHSSRGRARTGCRDTGPASTQEVDDPFEAVDELTFWSPKDGLAQAQELVRFGRFDPRDPGRPSASLALAYIGLYRVDEARRHVWDSCASRTGRRSLQALGLLLSSVLEANLRHRRGLSYSAKAIELLSRETDAPSTRRNLGRALVRHAVNLSRFELWHEELPFLERARPLIPRDGRRYHLALEQNFCFSLAARGEHGAAESALASAANLVPPGSKSRIHLLWSAAPLAKLAGFPKSTSTFALETLEIAAAEAARDGYLVDSALIAVDMAEMSLRIGSEQGLTRAVGRLMPLVTQPTSEDAMTKVIKNLLQRAYANRLDLDGLSESRASLRRLQA